MVYSLTEMFRSIQGEGQNAGTAAFFVRLAGCSMGCPWCDTDHRERFRMDTLNLGKDIIRSVHNHRIPLIVITGGEPTEQDIEPLVNYLMDQRSMMGYPTIAIETNGSGDPDMLTHLRECGAWITWSPKIPVDADFLGPLPKIDEIKVVLTSQVLLHPSWLVALEDHAEECGASLWVQPCSGDFKTAVDFVLERPVWRLSLQTHKLIGIA